MDNDNSLDPTANRQRLPPTPNHRGLQFSWFVPASHILRWTEWEADVRFASMGSACSASTCAQAKGGALTGKGLPQPQRHCLL